MNADVVSTNPLNYEPKTTDKKQIEKVWKWNKKLNAEGRVRSELVQEMRSHITENSSPMKIFEEVTGLDKLIELIVTQSNLYTQ